MVDSPKSADFTLRKILEVRSTRCYGATLIRRIRTHDFDINFSDINDIRNVQSTHH